MKNFLKKHLSDIIFTIIISIIVVIFAQPAHALEIYNPDTQQMDILPDLPIMPNSHYNSDRYIIARSWYGGYVLILVPTNVNAYVTKTIGNINGNTNVTIHDITFNTLGVSTSYRPKIYEISNDSWVGGTNTNSLGSINYFGTTINLYSNNTYSDILYNAGYGLNLPQLNNFTKVTITNNIDYLMFSDMSNGSFYIPYNAYQYYYARFSYFNSELKTQPWDTNIENFAYLTDELIRIDFDLSTYEGAKSILFQACHEDYSQVSCDSFHEYDIYIPNNIYMSNVTITQNEYGSYDYNYTISDNGTTSFEEYQQFDFGLTSTNPLLGTIFENFSSNTFGLTSIITSPLNLIQSITSNTCSNLVLPVPFTNSNITLPCMTTFYQNVLGNDLFNLYQVITFGLVSYWVIVRIFNLVKDFKNPDHDEIEVMDL